MSGKEITVDVSLGERSYPIHIGDGLLETLGARVAALRPNARCAIITDENVAALHAATAMESLSAAGFTPLLITVPAGEPSKSMAMLEEVLSQLLDARLERSDLVIALGGGVVGDLAGFAAAVYKRGMDFIQVPTSLLAQVDSSVGGKTGINAPSGKNLVGAFHQPSLVLADIDLLGTLAPRDYLAGYAEVTKYGLLGDAAFFRWLEANGARAAQGDLAARIHAVRRSCEMKAEIVARDETEQGDRALLNLGHTFGHALEAATGYSDRLLHGEGVSIGCLLAFEASAALGLCSQEAPSRVAAHFSAMGMRTTLADIPGDLPDADGLMELMTQDKKVKDGRIVFVLARDIGEAFVCRDAELSVVRRVLADGLRLRRD